MMDSDETINLIVEKDVVVIVKRIKVVDVGED